MSNRSIEPQGSPPPGAAQRAPTLPDAPPAPPQNSDSTVALAILKSTMTAATSTAEQRQQAFEFYREVAADAARVAYDEAFAAMQKELPIITQKGSSEHGKYGRWEDIVELVMPVVYRHGFGLSFSLFETPPGFVGITATLSYKGHRETSSFPFPVDESDEKSPIHAVTSATSYGKRYTGSAILNIVTKGEDDDGKAASKKRPAGPTPPPPPPITSIPKQPPPPPVPSKPVAVRGTAKKTVVSSEAVERAHLGSLANQIKGASSPVAVKAIADAFAADIMSMSPEGREKATTIITEATARVNASK